MGDSGFIVSPYWIDMCFGLSERCLTVLVLGDEIPYPPDSGKRIRTWNLLRRLAKRHSLSYLCYADDDDPAIATLASEGIGVHTVSPLTKFEGWQLYVRLFANLFSPYPYSIAKQVSRRFADKLTQLLNNSQFDLVQSEGTPCGCYLNSVIGVPRVLATHNIESQIWSRRARLSQAPAEKLFFGSQAVKMRWFERRALINVESAVAVTFQDARQMRDWGVSTITIVPNGVDVEFFTLTPDPVRPSELLFLGALDWYPNVDGLVFFLHETLPLILSAQPNATLRIVGRRPPESLRKLVAGNRQVELVGDAKDVRPYLASASVVVVPLRIGGGSRLKILEALAAGKAVVSTSVGAEGLEITPGRHFQLADTPLQFAQRTIALLSSEVERRHLGENGRLLAAERYNWDGIAIKLEEAWFKALARVPLRGSTLGPAWVRIL
jgi:glycosyltransferase involved in cell wall biosynthesis